MSVVGRHIVVSTSLGVRSVVAHSQTDPLGRILIRPPMIGCLCSVSNGVELAKQEDFKIGDVIGWDLEENISFVRGPS